MFLPHFVRGSDLKFLFSHDFRRGRPVCGRSRDNYMVKGLAPVAVAPHNPFRDFQRAPAGSRHKASGTPEKRKDWALDQRYVHQTTEQEAGGRLRELARKAKLITLISAQRWCASPRRTMLARAAPSLDRANLRRCFQPPDRRFFDLYSCPRGFSGEPWRLAPGHRGDQRRPIRWQRRF